MSTFFSRLFSSKPIEDGYTQSQREAIADLLVFCMCADRRIEFSELDLLNNQTKQLSWDSEVKVDDFLALSRARADKAHVSLEARVDYASDINARLLTNELKTEAISLSRRMFVADKDYVKTEKGAYSVIALAFGWPA